MRLLLLLSSENLKLAAAEAASVAGLKKYGLAGRLMTGRFVSGFLAKSWRLALTRRVFRLLFSCRPSGIAQSMKKYPWQRVCGKSFAVRLRNHSARALKYSEKELAGFVWRRLRRPVVNLENPDSLVEIFITRNQAFCCLLLSEVHNDFEARRPALRPGFSPSSMHPVLARVMVNLSGGSKGSVCDPFCGTGGILIEAGLMGCDVVGYDISGRELDKCKANLDHYGIKGYRLFADSAFAVRRKYDYIVSDLPYGRNSQLKGGSYAGFLGLLPGILRKRAVLAFPQNVRVRQLARRAGLKVEGEFLHYIHKSLSKRIVVLSQRRH